MISGKRKYWHSGCKTCDWIQARVAKEIYTLWYLDGILLTFLVQLLGQSEVWLSWNGPRGMTLHLYIMEFDFWMTAIQHLQKQFKTVIRFFELLIQENLEHWHILELELLRKFNTIISEKRSYWHKYLDARYLSE